MKKVKIVGQRGSWFAKYDELKLPIMWADEIFRSEGKQILRTDWLDTAKEHAAPKRKNLIRYFEPSLNSETTFIIAQAVDVVAPTREIKRYVGVFKGIVREVTPEIEIEITERIADAK